MSLYRRVRSAIARPVSTLRRAARTRTAERVDEAIRSRMDMVPIEETREEDIFVVGYPKSGNTWVQTMMAGLLFGLDSEHIPGRMVHALVPDVHLYPYYARWRVPMAFKSHHFPRPEYRRVVYLMRDGRDALCSYVHHRRAVGNGEVDFLRMVETGEGLPDGRKWHEHVEAWLSNPHGAEMMTLSYEDLKEDTVAELRRIRDFAGLERSDGILERVARGAAFERMRKKEERHGWPRWPEDERFVRRGQVGSYTDEMPPEVLAAFEREARPTLERCGYLVSAADARDSA